MSEGIDRMKEWFGRALEACDYDLRWQDKDKGESWRETPVLFLFNKMMEHVNLMMASGFEKVVIDTREGPMPGIEEKTTINLKTGHVHAIKVVNYALMIATRLAGDKVGVEVEPRLIIDPVPLYTGSAHTPSQEFIKKPLKDELKGSNEDMARFAALAGMGRAKEEGTSGSDHDKVVYADSELHPETKPDSIIETGLPPLDLGPLPNGPPPEAKPKEFKGIIDVTALKAKIRKVKETPVETESPPLTEVELKDIEESEKEYAKGEAPVFDSVEELLETSMGISVTPEEIESESYYCPWCEHTSTLGEGCRGKICCIKCGKPINSRFAKLLKKARQWDYVIMKKPVTSAKTAQYLGTSTSWAGKVLRELGWEQTRWRGVIWWRWNPPKEDGK